jgi:signal transduction histidine kinase
MILVASAARVVSHRRLRRRLAALAAQQAMERERMRIARDMHDEIGSKLTKISFMSERAIGELFGQEPVAKKLDSIARTSRDLLQSLDEIVWAVNPHNDTLEHLAAYLGQYATEYLHNTAVRCELRIARGLPEYPLTAEARHNLFLAFEEALNNALKHGHPSHIRIAMQMNHSSFEIRIEDDGCGFDSATSNGNSGNGEIQQKRVGNGIRNMRQRLADVGGECRFESRAGRGTVVVFRLPLAAEIIQSKDK